MDLFGLKAHEDQHQETARILRRMVEQVSQLTINLGQTRMELRKLSLQVEGKVASDDVDPAILKLNDALGRARVKLAEVAAAAEENWGTLSDELEDAVEDVNASLDDEDEDEDNKSDEG